MKKTNILLAVIIGLMTVQLSAQELKVMTFNLRYANETDKPYHWDARKEGVVDRISKERPALLGIQEGLSTQIKYLDAQLPSYSRAGVGRDNGDDEGEYSAIYYDNNRFELKEQKTIWLSDTPETVSLGWDGACKRVMTYVVLRDKKNGKEIVYFNTHFDHIGKAARENSAKLVVEEFKTVANGRPFIFSGDLNATIDDQPIQYILHSGLVSNSREAAQKKSGPENSYHDFGKVNTGIIDYIMVSDEFTVKEQTVIDAKYNDLFLSDHYPIVAKLIYKK